MCCFAKINKIDIYHCGRYTQRSFKNIQSDLLLAKHDRLYYIIRLILFFFLFNICLLFILNGYCVKFSKKKKMISNISYDDKHWGKTEVRAFSSTHLLACTRKMWCNVPAASSCGVGSTASRWSPSVPTTRPRPARRWRPAVAPRRLSAPICWGCHLSLQSLMFCLLGGLERKSWGGFIESVWGENKKTDLSNTTLQHLDTPVGRKLEENRYVAMYSYI